MPIQNIQKKNNMLVLQSVFNLLNKNFSYEQIVNLILQTEQECFIKELQETKETYLLRVKTNPKTVLLFFNNDDYVGYLTAEFITKIPENFEQISFNHIPQKNFNVINDYLYISSFGINKDFRGKNYGSKAFSLAQKYFTNLGTKKFLLLVNETWEAAIHIYQKMGYKTLKHFPKAFPPTNSTGILMQKKSETVRSRHNPCDLKFHIPMYV